MRWLWLFYCVLPLDDFFRFFDTKNFDTKNFEIKILKKRFKLDQLILKEKINWFICIWRGTK